jgi:hypothetical protein
MPSVEEIEAVVAAVLADDVVLVHTLVNVEVDADSV